MWWSYCWWLVVVVLLLPLHQAARLLLYYDCSWCRSARACRYDPLELNRKCIKIRSQV